MSTINILSDIELEELKGVLDEWCEVTSRKQITLVTAGRSDAGKSTLIGNMLQLKGDHAPERRYQPSSTTTEVKTYTNTVNGVEVRIIDTPGLAASDVNEARIIAELQAESGGKAHMLLYCISLLPSSKIDEQDANVIKTLKVAFGPDIWGHAILVLTFANTVMTFLERGQTFSGVVQDYATKFESILRSQCPSFSVCSIFSCDQKEIKRDLSTVIALPAGIDPKQELVEGMKWDDSIYMEVLKKCNPDAIPALLKVREPTSEMAMLALKLEFYTKIAFDSVIATAIAATGGRMGALVARETFRSIKKRLESFRKRLDDERELKALRKDMKQN